jgi:hypothetical protein
MPLMSKPSSAPRTALFYITTGALLVVWSTTWYFLLTPDTNPKRFLDAGMFMTGVVLLVIGFGLGHLGRMARQAELPPKEATAAEAKIDQNAAARGAAPPGTTGTPPVATPNQVSTASPNG